MVGHQSVLVRTETSPFRCRNEDPTVHTKRQEDDNLGPEWSQEETSVVPQARHVGPVEAQIQEAHATETCSNEVRSSISWSNPAEES